MIAAGVTLVLYFIACFVEFLAPFSVTKFDERYPYAPPQRLHIIDTSGGTGTSGCTSTATSRSSRPRDAAT